jgi:hypothetical protein
MKVLITLVYYSFKYIKQIVTRVSTPSNMYVLTILEVIKPKSADDAAVQYWLVSIRWLHFIDTKKFNILSLTLILQWRRHEYLFFVRVSNRLTHCVWFWNQVYKHWHKDWLVFKQNHILNYDVNDTSYKFFSKRQVNYR